MFGINEDNVITSFVDFLNENKLELSSNWHENDKIIDIYISSLYYDIQDNVDNIQEQFDIEDYIENILKDYCDSNTIPLF